MNLKSPLLFILIFLGGQFSLFADSYIFGVMKNSFVNDRIELRIPHYYIDGKSSSSIEFTDNEGHFVIKADIKEPQLVFLVHNEDRLPIYLEPNDTLNLSTDRFQFPLVATFFGRAGHNNRLLHQYFEQYPQDFNEFNNLRYKIGNWWTTVEAPMDDIMNRMAVEDFSKYMLKRKEDATIIMDTYMINYPNQITESFKNYLYAEILYDWAYHLLFYGNIYRVKHSIEPSFFEFLDEAPSSNDMVGSDAYRRFLLTFMSYRQAKTGRMESIYADQYLDSSDYLSDKALAFFRSEIIHWGLKAERYNEVLSFYNSFLQNNKLHEYDDKITDLYEKAVKVSPGVLAPSFVTTDRLGSQIQLSQFSGKVVYLNFWASWCASCIKKMNLLGDYSNEFDKEGIVLVNVSLDTDTQNWHNSISENNFSGYHLLSQSAGNPDVKSIAAIYNVEAVPQYFFINKDGTFAEKGYSNQLEDIRKRLTELSR
jgi:thiol-disulfide isomerase/thioredoxin